ncbi:DUF3467 domain-containing protein [Amphritea pacifica]|uniref:DUF3467 domain-containing protein n=1 Tax=Amphritea pacifica TaxID=2811233 RepID=A0ABS2W4W2_9GAMM|nr:DUF3467 domain-containing protein [Amphritea pacifica]MBN0986547.1 DUF3467 domain-containing protein [Amphritea pacifica]MBN1006128.1 DUF3467 domain-containing protein [Amphritea pacifica]
MAEQDNKVQGPTIRWDDSKMKSTYANVCNVSSTREEITLLFGLNQAWNAQQKQLTIELSDRIILNPYAAKRMADLLNNVLSKYEQRFGEIGQGSPEAAEAVNPESH